MSQSTDRLTVAEKNALTLLSVGKRHLAHAILTQERLEQRAAAQRAFYADVDASPRLRDAMAEAIEQGKAHGHSMVHFDPWVGNSTRAECFYYDCDAAAVITVDANGLHVSGHAIDADCMHAQERER